MIIESIADVRLSNMEFNFNGKTALVTGAGKGIYLRNEFNFWNVN